MLSLRAVRTARFLIPTLLVSTASAGFNNPETPAFRGQPNTEFAGWENFTSGFMAPNFPDDAMTTADDAVIVQMTPGGIVTSTGNLYNPAGPPSIVLSDSVPSDLQYVVVQAATAGTPPDYGSFVLTYVDGGGSTVTLPPTSSVNLWNAGGALEDRFDWDLSGIADVITSYTVEFVATGAHMSLDALLLDTDFDGETAIGTAYCDVELNSTGVEALTQAFGSTAVAADDLTLVCTDMPQNQFGYFLASQTQGFVANPGGSQGNLCLAQPLGRFAALIQNSGSTGSVSITVDTTDVPQLGAIQAGETWYFQCWFRDIGSNSNFSNGVSVSFQ